MQLSILSILYLASGAFAWYNCVLPDDYFDNGSCVGNGRDRGVFGCFAARKCVMADPKTEDSLETCNLQTIEKQFKINTYGPFLLTQALLPNILAAPEPRRVSVVSSRVGSIGDNTSGGYYAYRASKTAANSFFKSLSVDLKDKGVIVTMLHPGFTKTNLSPDIWKIPGAVS
ncbi:hypothetical protein AC578_1381 [Pseudocercospora eumusae]|uniref:Uncharacterized protein n=1 Tax=Pseudocercospora eumusae TaxID=321146 RepID=A0A139HUS1_9PEZI|nr:hypothetical protein AC578_1381 [Pseudocercospora eumusae]